MDANIVQVRLVVNPALAPRTERWLRRLIERQAHPDDRMMVERLGTCAVIACVLGMLVSGLAGPWAFLAAVSVIARLALRHEIGSAGLRRHRGNYVISSDLDDACLLRLRAAQRAIDAVLASEVYRTGKLEHAAGAADLRRHEWEIASRLRDIAAFRAEHADSLSAGIPGPATAAVLDAHLRAITIAQNAITRRVSELERYAREVMAADAALHDWRSAEYHARKNDRHLDLVARSVADDHAVAEFTYLTGHARHTRDAFEVTLQQAALAAQPLVLTEPISADVAA